MADRKELLDITTRIAAAIAKRDVKTLAGFLAPDFVHRRPGGLSADAVTFLAAVDQIPGDIEFVNIENLEVDLAAGAALVTGIQHAQVNVDGNIIDDRRAFADFFIRLENAWQLRVAVDLPVTASQSNSD
jgi:hypothetical protein